MGLFSKFKSKPQGKLKSATLKVAEHSKLTGESAKITFEVPAELKDAFQFSAGQYLNLHCPNGNSMLIRSYSICSGPAEGLSIGVKAVANGTASKWLVHTLKAGDEIEVDFPQGHFGLQKVKKHVAFAAGSGITPVLSMAKSLEGTDEELVLYYGNASRDKTMFGSEIDSLKNTKAHYYYSRENGDGILSGRFDKQLVSEIIKADLSLLRAGAFYVCGPEEMIVGIKEVLEVFGIKEEQVHFELFTPPVLLVPKATEVVAEYSGDCEVTALLNGEKVTVKLNTSGKTILEALDSAGLDVPFSCRGGVCCTCKAKIVEGSAQMRINFALTDQEVAQGYILTCQSHPTSKVLKINYDA